MQSKLGCHSVSTCNNNYRARYKTSVKKDTTKKETHGLSDAKQTEPDRPNTIRFI